MLRSFTSALARAPALCLGLLGLAAVTFGACPRAQPARFVSEERGGVRLEVLPAKLAPSGPRAQGRPGDFLLSSAELRLVIARTGPLAGVVVDATAGEWVDDQLTGVLPVVELDGSEVPSVVRSVEPDLSGPTPRVTVVRESASVRVTTEIAIAPARSFLELSSRIENHGTVSRRLRLGDRVTWFGEDSFAPGFGFVSDARELVVPWFSHSGRRQSYALAFPERAASVRFRRREMGAHEQTALGAELSLPPGGSARHVRRLLVARGPAERVAEEAWRAVGDEPGFIEGELAPAPAWAVIEARDDAGRSIGSGQARAGKFSVPVPAGTYQVVLRSPGGTDRARAVVRKSARTSVALIPPRPARIEYRVSDEHDAPMPARLVVRGVAPTVNPDLGPYHLAAGAANVACTATGTGSLELPPGRYSVLATRGPEFDLVESVMDVSATAGATFRASLSRVVDTRGWIAADLHLHADPSGDSEVPLPDRVTSLLAEGIELAAATDHNHVTDYAPAVRALGAEKQLATLTGIEVTTRDWGHFNAYPYPPSAPLPPASEAAPRELLAWLRATAPGALLQVNHPRMGDIGYFNQIALDPSGNSAKASASLDFDLLEVWNGFDLANLSVLDDVLGEWLRLIASGRRFTAVGNSDSHRIVYQWAGYPRTYVLADDQRPGGVDWTEAAASLRAGRALVTSGPFIELKVNGEPVGALVKAEQGSVGVELEVRAPPWIEVERAELLLDGKLALHVEKSSPEQQVSTTPRARLRFVGSLPIARDSFLVVVVRGASTLERVLPGTNVVPVAFTNPVFIDADGDGSFVPQPSSRARNE